MTAKESILKWLIEIWKGKLMSGRGMHVENWTDLYETYFANAERVTEEIDRLAADIKDSKDASARSHKMLQELNRLANELAVKVQEIKGSWHNAEQVAIAAGDSAAKSLTDNIASTSAILCGRLEKAAATVEQTTGQLRRVSLQTRTWCLICIVVAIVSTSAGAFLMHRLNQRDAATQQDVYLRLQGVVLGRMAQSANKKERAVLNELYQREHKALAETSAAQR